MLAAAGKGGIFCVGSCHRAPLLELEQTVVCRFFKNMVVEIVCLCGFGGVLGGAERDSSSNFRQALYL